MKKPGKVPAVARQTHPTTSELMRHLILGNKLPDAQRNEVVLELMKINTDLARLGNTLRLALFDEDIQISGHQDLIKLFNNIQTIRTIIKTKVEEL